MDATTVLPRPGPPAKGTTAGQDGRPSRPTRHVLAGFAARHEVTGWALAQDGALLDRGIEDGPGHDPDAARLAVAERLVTMAGEQAVRLVVHTNDERLHDALRRAERAAMSIGDPPVVPGFDPALASEAARLVEGLVGDVPERVIAVDGSYHRCTGQGGWAWVDATGAFRYGPAGRTGGALGAEVRAIVEAARSVRHVPEGVRPTVQAVVLVDSRDAIRAVTDWVENRSTASLPGSRKRWEKVLAPLDGLNLRLEWVRGHTGHPMNEAADRLSRLARRTLDASTGADDVVARSVIEDTMGDVSPLLPFRLPAGRRTPISA